MIATTDLTGLSHFTACFARAVEIQSFEAVNYQTGRLMGDLSKAVPPQTIQKADKKANWQVRKSFYAVKRGDDIKEFGGTKPIFTGRKAGKGNPVWLYASPLVVVGTAQVLDMRDRDAGSLIDIHLNQQKRTEPRWIETGRRRNGRGQRVMMVNKPVIRSTAARALSRRVRDSFGKLKASFAKGAPQVRASLRLPKFAERHLVDAKGYFTPAIRSTFPVSVIASQSPGCEHPRTVRLIHGAIKSRTFKMKKDIELFWSGKKKAEDFRKNNGFVRYIPTPEDTSFSE